MNRWQILTEAAIAAVLALDFGTVVWLQLTRVQDSYHTFDRYSSTALCILIVILTLIAAESRYGVVRWMLLRCGIQRPEGHATYGTPLRSPLTLGGLLWLLILETLSIIALDVSVAMPDHGVVRSAHPVNLQPSVIIATVFLSLHWISMLTTPEKRTKSFPELPQDHLWGGNYLTWSE